MNGCCVRFDLNRVGQVHAYISDLRKIPFNEQYYWRTFNENPKATVSERARVSDFHGFISH